MALSPARILEEARASGDGLPGPEATVALRSDPDLRTAVGEALLALPPEGLPLARLLFDLHTEAGGEMSDDLRLFSFLLFRLGQPEDSLRVWKAKHANFDAGCGLDLQLALGAGIERTFSFLRASDDPLAPEILEDLQSDLEGGFLIDPDEFRRFYGRYFNP